MSLSDDVKAWREEMRRCVHSFHRLGGISDCPICSPLTRILGAVEEMKEGLTILYEETADYIRLNNLGDVHHNRSMQLARTILERWK